MQHATDDSVLGDFNNTTFKFKGKDNRFFRKDGQFWVNIEGPGGKFNNYQIKYTFAYTPLQQYMVEFDDGRVQLIPFAWDSRKQSMGGQRWFHLYPEYTQNHQDFFWTNSGQNWNYMCADCHSTNVQKNFDLATNSYNTTFSEINVACEACHGPASEHIAWTKKPQPSLAFSGFNRDLTESAKNWSAVKGQRTATPQKIRHSQQVLVCAQCHSRRLQISTDDHVQNKAFGDRHLLNLIDSEQYYPDGQVYNEDFVYGSFLQSKMHKNAVVCSNCHDPHSAQLKQPIESVCLQCHQPQTYAQASHHHHQENSKGAQCVNCHMPETTYMQIDSRRDHGFHIPRPDLALQLNTPDTCLSCHSNKDSNWSLKHTKQWNPDSAVIKEKDFAPIFAAASQGYQGASAELSRIAQTPTYAAIIRASALSRMAAIADTNSIIAVARGAKNEDSNIRLGAINGAENFRAPEKWRLLTPLLNDKVLAVRTEAAMALVPLWPSLSEQQQQRLTPALNEYIAIQDFNNDRGFAHTNKGNIYSYQGRIQKAINAYQQSIKVEPYFSRAYINMADLYRQQQQNDNAIQTLKKGTVANPENSAIEYSLGLAYIRNKQTQNAIQHFERATILAPNNANYFYIFGLSLETESPAKAYQSLYSAFKLSNNPQHLYALCEMQVRQLSSQAGECLEKLSLIAPAEAIAALKAQYQASKK